MTITWGSLPTLSPILQDRKLALAILASAGLLLALFAFGVPGWQCPFLHYLGVPCPGCGLTRATYWLLRGDIRTALTFHAFAPLSLLLILVVTTAGVLPEQPRRTFLTQLEVLERRTGIGLILLAGLFLYWVVRLVVLNESFVKLIQG